MTDFTTATRLLAAEEEAPATKVRGYWQNVGYRLRYDYAQAPGVLKWRMLRGDIMRTIDGAYNFAPAADGGTEVRYDLAIELVVPLPGFVKRRAEVRILNTVRELKTRAEA